MKSSYVSQMTLSAIRDALRAGGYGALVKQAAAIREAAEHGCLLWTAKRLTTTDANRIDARPTR